MSHTNQTANYHLPQFIGTDKPAWLVDVNQAYADIDTQMKANETASATAEADAQSALSGVTALTSQVGTLQTSVTALETAQPLDEAQIETNRQNIATNAQNIVDLDNRMGHTSISTIGDGTATGAIADLQTQIDAIPTPTNPDADNVSYDNTTSGLTATNVQDAIDELNEDVNKYEIGTNDVDIITYNTIGAPYTCPSDGYIYAYCATASNNVAVQAIKSDNTSTVTLLAMVHLDNSIMTVFVKKGTKVYVSTNYGTSNNVRFYPIV